MNMVKHCKLFEDNLVPNVNELFGGTEEDWTFLEGNTPYHRGSLARELYELK